MEGESDSHWRGFDCNSDLQLDILDDESETDMSSPPDSPAEPWKHLAQAKESSLSQERSLMRSSKKSSMAKRAKTAKGDSTKVNVSPERRISEFSGKMLAASAGKLICDACHCKLALKKSIIRDHIASSRHQAGKQKRKDDELRQQRVLQSWESYQEWHGKKKLIGTGLSEVVPKEQSLRHIDVVRAFLRAGISLAKIDALRPFLESGAEHLTFSTHLSSYIPFILEMEQHLLLEELNDKTIHLGHI